MVLVQNYYFSAFHLNYHEECCPFVSGKPCVQACKFLSVSVMTESKGKCVHSLLHYESDFLVNYVLFVLVRVVVQIVVTVSEII